MANRQVKSSRLCGARSPWYRADDAGGRRVADLCTRPAGHRGSHRWWGYVDHHQQTAS